MLGVQGETAGWGKVSIKPDPLDLTWARGSVPLPHEGRIDVAWKLDAEGRMDLQVWLPDSVQADVQLPDGIQGEIQIYRIGADADAVTV